MHDGKIAAAVASDLVPSADENYARDEGERAQNDLAFRALRYAKDCGATFEWPPPSDLENILRSDFWFFICNAAAHRRVFEGPAQRVEDTKKRLSELVKTMLPLLELLREESYTRALGALAFENWLMQRFAQTELIAGERVAGRMRQCLELLLAPLEHAFSRSKGPRGAAVGDRNNLIRWALEQSENSGGWWPANPTDEDLTALSILSGAYLQNFEDDFDSRQQLSDETPSSAKLGTHLDALWRRERRRFGELRRSVS